MRGPGPAISAFAAGSPRSQPRFNPGARCLMPRRDEWVARAFVALFPMTGETTSFRSRPNREAAARCCGANREAGLPVISDTLPVPGTGLPTNYLL